MVEESALGAPLIPSMGWWIDMVDADMVANDGTGIYVAVLDTGLLANWMTWFPPGVVNIRDDLGKGFSYDFTWDSSIGDYVETWNPNRGFITNAYGSGHGTHVTSIITGFQWASQSRWYRGVAPKVNIIPVLCLDTWLLPCPDPNYPGYHGGYVLWTGGSYEMVAAAINYVADLAETLHIKIIINMSLGGVLPGTLEEAAINYAISKGVIVVASAGNNGEFGMGWPGAFPQAISAAACGWTDYWFAGYRGDVPEKLNRKDRLGNNWQTFLEDFSARPNPNYVYGTFQTSQSKKDLDVCTPGQAVVGPYKPYVYWSGTAWVNPAIAYYYVWGTSQAAPHVAGIAALVAQSYPELNQASMEWILKKAAGQCPLPSDGAGCYDLYPYWYDFFWNDHDYGNGLLQAPAALKWADTYNNMIG
jgi:subtilisin family serine protease